MKRTKIEKCQKLLMPAALLITAMTVIGVYLLSQNMPAVIGTACGMLLLCGIGVWHHRLEEQYLTAMVSDLSRLTDVLIELEEKNVFPENEDTIVSKLQSKIQKLARILKVQKETAMQEQEDIKTLVSDISHQLKTPLANLKMYSAFLTDAALPEKRRKEYVQIIQICSDRLCFLSESMIKISRLESGLIRLDLQEQSLNETVLMAVKEIYVKAKKCQVEIVYQEEMSNIKLLHDRNWTAEAVFNLLDNAVKYARPDTKIYLSICRLGMFSSVSVADENAPIPEEERTKIFTRFYRGSNSRNSEGIGIGLYLSREIAVKQGGYMNLKVSDHGNTFLFVLPR